MKKYISNSFWLLLEMFSRLIIGLIVGILLARYLGPENFGHLSYVLVIYAILKVFSSFGLEQVVVKDLSENKISGTVIKSNYFFLKAVFGIICLSCFVVYAFTSSSDVLVLATPLIATLAIQGFDIYELQCQSIGESRRLIKRTLAAVLLVSAVKVGLIYLGASVYIFILFLSVEYCIILLCFYSIKIPSEKTLDLSFVSKSYIRSRLKQSWPLFFSSASILIYMKIDLVMIYHFHGAAESGIYAISSRISEILYFIPSVILSGMFPALIKSRASSMEEYKNIAEDLCSALLITSISFIVFFTLFGEFIVITLFGGPYISAVPILLIHVFACIPVFPGVVFRKMVVADGNQKITMYATLIGLVLNLCLNFILIPSYGGLGAAYATLVSRMVGSLMVYFIFKETRYFLTIFAHSLLPHRWLFVISKLKRLFDESFKKQI